jgi:hypothetical protein
MSPLSDMRLVDLYGKIGRIIQISNWKEVIRWTYCDIGEQTKVVAWQARKDLVKKFLVGTQPTHPELYQVMEFYNKLKDAEALKVGNIDGQYRDFLNRLSRDDSSRSLLSATGSSTRIL